MATAPPATPPVTTIVPSVPEGDFVVWGADEDVGGGDESWVCEGVREGEGLGVEVGESLGVGEGAVVDAGVFVAVGVDSGSGLGDATVGEVVP